MANPFKVGDDPRRNLNGRPSRRSLKWHANEHYTDADREASIKALAREARKGKAWAIETLCKLLGEGQAEPTAATVNILAILAGTDRPLLERLFAALPLGAGDAGGLGGLRLTARGDVEAGVDAVEAPDADQRRAATDRQR